MGAESIVANIVAGGGGELLHGLSEVIDSVKGHSPETAAALETIRANYLQSQVDLQKVAINADVTLATSQNDVTKVEAGNATTFVAGWRPYIGWICGSAMAYAFIAQPFIVTIFMVIQCMHTHTSFTKDMLPILDMSQMWPVLIGLLGLGGLRTLEKVQGVAPAGAK